MKRLMIMACIIASTMQSTLAATATFATKHPIIYKAAALIRYPYRWGCALGRWSERTGFTSFLGLCGAAGSIATPFVAGFKGFR